MKPNLGIADKNRDAVTRILNDVLADEYVLYTKTRNYHWNVQGPQFSELHKFFQVQYESLDNFIDDVAERARSLGGRAIATLHEFGKTARLQEHPGEFPNTTEMIENLLNDHQNLIRTLRADQAACSEKYGDAGTCDFLTGLMEEHEKMAWMLRSLLES